MEVQLKRIGCPSKNIMVTEHTTVAELVLQAGADCLVECERISLVFKGVPLTDKTMTLKDYSIGPGDKIMVVVKAAGKPTFEQLLQKYLNKEYNAEDSVAIYSSFMKLLSSTLDSLSIDDIERLAYSFNEL